MVTTEKWDVHVEKALERPDEEAILKMVDIIRTYDTMTRSNEPSTTTAEIIRTKVSKKTVFADESFTSGPTSQKKWLMVFEPQNGFRDRIIVGTTGTIQALIQDPNIS